MSGLFNKKVRRNYRAKAEHSDEESVYEPESLYEQGSKGIICGSHANGSTIKKVRSVLSFEDDLDPDDGNEFQVKKAPTGHRTGKQMKDQKKKPKDTDAIKVVGTIQVMKKEAIKVEDPAESEEKLKHLRRQLLDLNGDEVDVPVKARPRDVDSSLSDVSSIVKKGSIPDAATIHLARKQREKAKVMMEHAESTTVQSASSSADGKRLIREDDDDDEEEDFDDGRVYEHRTGLQSTASERRPAFVVSDVRDTLVKRPAIGVQLKRREAERESMRQNFLAAEHGSDRDSDQEVEWERQQIQKAMITHNPAIMDAIQPVSHRDDGGQSNLSEPGLFAGLDASEVTVANLKSSLLVKYNTISKSLDANEAALTKAKADLARGKNVIGKSKQELPSLAKTFGFAQELKCYVDDLIDCFNEKMTKIEYLERRTNILFREQYKKLVERRRFDVKDLADQASQTQSQTNPKVQEDAKVVEARRRRTAEREARRMRRHRAREQAGTTTQHQDGMSTDDEEPQAVIAKRKADIDALIIDANAIFEDVEDEFCQLPQILQHFTDWRRNFPQSYTEAYVALCLPQLFNPIVRVQLIGWNPLFSSGDCIEKMRWFHDLLDFISLPVDSSSDSSELDDQLKLIPLTVEKIIMDRLNELVESYWDPLSEKASSRLVKIVGDLCSAYPTIRLGSKTTEQLFITIAKRLEVTIQEDIFIPLYSKQLMQNRQSPAFQFFERQFNTGLKMLKNIILWQDLICSDALKHLSLTCLINRYLLVGLASLLSAANCTRSPSGADDKATTVIVGLNASAQQRSSVLSFQEAVDKLGAIVNGIPIEWARPDREASIGESMDKNGDVQSSQAADPFAQLRRFVDQLLENCSAVGSQHLEHEWISTLTRIKNKLG